MPHSANAVATPVQDDIINGCTASKILHGELVWIPVPGILTAIRIAKAFHPVAAEARLQLPSVAPSLVEYAIPFLLANQNNSAWKSAVLPRALPELLNFY